MNYDDQDISMDVVRETVHAYDLDAVPYAAATKAYEAFPGMHDIVLKIRKNLPSHAKILDAGSGSGRDSMFLSHNSRHVVALDHSKGLLGALEAEIQGRAISPVQGDMRSLPFQDDVFDVVLASASLLHLLPNEIEGAVREFSRVLSPSGNLYVTMQMKGETGWSIHGAVANRRWQTIVEPDRMIRTFQSAGLVDIHWQPSGRGPWYLILGKKPRLPAHLPWSYDQG